MLTSLRPQQYRLSWPLTPSQVEGLDAMLETLFKRLRAMDIAASASASGSGDFDHQMIGSVVGRFPFDVIAGDDGEMGAPGLIGVVGAQGLKGNPGFDGDAGDDGVPGIPGLMGATGSPGLVGPPGADGQDGDDANAPRPPSVIDVGWVSGSVVFATLSNRLSQDNANFFWDAANIRLGIGNTVFGSSSTRLMLNNTSPFSTILEFQTNTNTNTLVGIAGAVNQFTTGTVASDFCFGQKGARRFIFSTNLNSADSMALTVGATTGGISLGTTYAATDPGLGYLIMEGRLGIGQSAPTALIHLKAGTATASTAPLKFTSGTSLTAAEAGAMEFTTDDFFLTITTGAARKGIILDNGTRLTSGKVPVATTNGRLIDATATLFSAAGVANVVASTFEKAETGTDANVLTYTTNGSIDEFLVVSVSTDVSALTGTSVVVTVTWKDSNNATATSSITLGGVTDGTINVPINAFKNTNVVVSTVFTGVSTAYNISAFVTRLK